MKRFTVKELAAFDGKDGRPVYIAHKGNVYDVSESKMWKRGRHMQRHNAGVDLTADILAAPHDTAVLERYPQVGVLDKAQPPERQMPAFIAWMLDSNPFLRRHPHPMTVHFPIVFMLAYPFFNILYWVTGNQDFETTAFHCLGGGLFFMVVAMITGFLTWWYNYMAKMLKPVAIKIPLSALTLALAVVSFIWRWRAPEVMTNPQGANMLYLFCSLAFIPLIGIIGWYGATMTFPIEEE